MGININMEGIKIGGNAEVLNDLIVKGSLDTPVDIVLKNAKIFGHAVVLKNVRIDSVLNELSKEAQAMNTSSSEYLEIQKILGKQKWDVKEFTRCIKNHLVNFSEGVLASILAAYLTSIR